MHTAASLIINYKEKLIIINFFDEMGVKPHHAIAWVTDKSRKNMQQLKHSVTTTNKSNFKNAQESLHKKF